MYVQVTLVITSTRPNIIDQLFSDVYIISIATFSLVECFIHDMLQDIQQELYSQLWPHRLLFLSWHCYVLAIVLQYIAAGQNVPVA